MGFAIATVAARLLARPILQEYDAFTVVELNVKPARFFGDSRPADVTSNVL